MVQSLKSIDTAIITEISQDCLVFTNAIQKQGVLFVLKEPDLKIIQVSDNTKQFFGISAHELLNQTLERIFRQSEIDIIRDRLQRDNLEWYNPIKLLLYFEEKSEVFEGVLRRQPEGLILELEVSGYPYQTSHLSFYHLFRSCYGRIKQGKNLRDLAQKIAYEIRYITGFDRVMIYRFKEDNSGVVIAEEKTPSLNSFLDLHFPETDIPPEARELYHQNLLQLISNVNAQPVAIIPDRNSLTNQPLNLSLSALRSFSPCHIEYLKNMGVSASMSLGLIKDNKLWGIIACHHYSPKYISYEVRKICEFIAESVIDHLLTAQKTENWEQQDLIKQLQTYLKTPVRYETDLLSRLVHKEQQSLLNLVSASGAALCYGGSINLVGKTPHKSTIRDLIIWLESYHKQQSFATHTLSKVYPQGEAIKTEASGLLSVSIVLNNISYHILWFRPEVVQTIEWAGDPSQSLSVDDEGKIKLSPRQSFELWKETVQATAIPWQEFEQEAAEKLREGLLLAALEFSHKAMEEAANNAETANRAKSEFLANMSHELRTPLNAILGFAQVMRRSQTLDKEHQENLSIITRSGEHLLNLINQVLDLSKIEAGRILFNQTEFDFYRLLDDLEDMFQFKADEKRLQLLFERLPDVPQYIRTDQVKLRQVFINLLNNALKFTEEGGVSVRVRGEKLNFLDGEHTREIDRSNRTIIVEIEDTGHGISEEELDHLFEPFVQSQSGKDHHEGTGLGLPISRKFVQLMGGELTVNSEVGRGTIFRFHIHAEEIEPTEIETQTQGKRHVIALAPNQPKYRILVVDDRWSNRELVIKLLTPLGFEVRPANNGEEAIQVWEKWEPHLIWMDMRMPVIDGYEATKRIKATIKGQATAIIALTASVFEEEKAVVLSAGCDGFIRKPFKEAEIFNAMEKQIGVQFIYENDEKPSQEAPDINVKQAINQEILATLSDSWIGDLKQAIINIDSVMIDSLLAQIKENHPDLVHAIYHLTDNFEYEKLLNLLE
ncbi:ATP-binding protein [Crocosphaera sp.]|uniref:ATP-binding protein n=1 Tax=Crocosphaera sp. TaxID=2729996 RepID=UPI003F23DB25|nr:ATP-binding protein [Crocosphaera sp.]